MAHEASSAFALLQTAWTHFERLVSACERLVTTLAGYQWWIPTVAGG